MPPCHSKLTLVLRDRLLEGPGLISTSRKHSREKGLCFMFDRKRNCGFPHCGLISNQLNKLISTHIFPKCAHTDTASGVFQA